MGLLGICCATLLTGTWGKNLVESVPLIIIFLNLEVLS